MQSKKYIPNVSIKNNISKLYNVIITKSKNILDVFSIKISQYNFSNNFNLAGNFFYKINIFKITKVIITSTFLFFFGYMIINANDFGNITIKKTIQNEIMNLKDQDNDLTSLQNIVLTDSNRPWRFIYIVQRWDTIDSIANDFGVTVKSIKNANKISNNKVSIWQELNIAEIEGMVYTTTSDTSLLSFAGKYGISIDDLKELNYISDESHVIPKWDEIFLPIQHDEAVKLWLIQETKDDAEFKAFIKTNDKIQKVKENQVVDIKHPTNNPKPNPIKPIVVKSTKKIWSVRSLSTKWRNNFGFALWNCTWYAAQMRPDIFLPWQSRPFGGNGKQRYYNAKSAWFKVSKNPSIWAVVVFSKWRWWYGHVWIVRWYDSDSLTLESMNYRGRFIVSVDEVWYNWIIWYIPYQ